MATPGDEASFPVASVTLAARVVSDEGKFVAAVERLETADEQGEPLSAAAFDGMAAGLEGIADTADGAMDALTLAMRGWLERQDTADQLGVALGLPGLDDDTEIILRFIAGDGDGDDADTGDGNTNDGGAGVLGAG